MRFVLILLRGYWLFPLLCFFCLSGFKSSRPDHIFYPNLSKTPRALGFKHVFRMTYVLPDKDPLGGFEKIKYIDSGGWYPVGDQREERPLLPTVE